MEGKVAMFLVFITAAIVCTSLADDVYSSTRYCRFTYTTINVHQQLVVHGYKDTKQCQARVTINTCGGSCKASSSYYFDSKTCMCCKPYGTKWVSKWVTYNCGYNVYQKAQWWVVEPKSCVCTKCY